ncbi:unnamed protein product [Sphenostylis stenocarpa]|uniref:Uncharacterized protein n=1 Tax=Sphenostylis stenocarpa TaxID=92480 RepID=A0AA86SEC1_9FABA|nr:unnamed protein product [Sphenostylis stenocarpa]
MLQRFSSKFAFNIPCDEFMKILVKVCELGLEEGPLQRIEFVGGHKTAKQRRKGL